MTTCPYCNYRADQHEELENEDSSPEIGDISFCINCSSVSMFEKGGLAKIIFDELNEKTKAEIKKIEDAWLQTRSLRKLPKKTDREVKK